MHLNGWQLFILVGLVFCLINIVTIMGPINPLAAAGTICYVLLSLPYIFGGGLK